MRRDPTLLHALAAVLVLGLALGLVAAPAARAAELEGVRLDDSAKVGDATLVLNGVGLRKKAIFKVYVGGLYLAAKQSDATKILAEDGPRRIAMQFVRNVGKDSLCGAWNDGLAANTPGASAEVQADFAKLCDWMEDVATGDRLVFTYAPGTGTEVEVKGKAKGTLAGKPFADAIFGCFIGPSPPSADFKKGLLGG